MKRNVYQIVVTMILLSLALSVAVASAEPVQVRLAGWTPGTPDGNLLAEYVNEFNALHPDIQIVLEAYQGEEPMLVGYAAGTAPDIVIVQGPAPLSYGGEGGIFLALDHYIDGERGFDRGIFVPDMWSFTTVDGKAYGIALDTNERALFVHSHLAQSAGLDIQGDTIRDWDDLLEVAKRLTVRRGDQTVQWGFWTNFENTGGTMWHWIYLNDGQLFSEDGLTSTVDHPNTIEAIEYLADMIHEHGVAPPHGGQGRNAFLNNELGMLITHAGFIGILDDANIDFVTIPGPPGVGKQGGRFSGATTSVFSIIDTTQVPDQAWEFVRWMATQKALDLANRRTQLPLTLEGLRDPRFQSQPWNAFAVSVMTYSPEYYYHARVSARHWWSGAGLLNPTIQAILRREQAAEPALKQVAARVTATMQEIRQGE